MRATWKRFLVRAAACVMCVASASTLSAGDSPWRHPLYLDGGGYWRARLPIVIRNRSDSPLDGAWVEIDLAGGGRGGELIGQRAEALRVCDGSGVEMRLALRGPDGSRIEAGPIPAGSRLAIPVECPARSDARYDIYFDNPRAGRPPSDSAPAAAAPNSAVQVKVLPVQRMTLRRVGHGDLADWPADAPARRAQVRVFHFGDRPLGDVLVSVDLTMIQARMRGKLDPRSLRVMLNGESIPHVRKAGSLLFRVDLPARSVTSCQIYFGDRSSGRPAEASDQAAWSAILAAHNRVRNPSFEKGGAMPEAWSATGPARGPDGVTFGIDSQKEPGLGVRCVRMHVPANAPTAWRGWRQSVPVRPGGVYLLTAWVKCANVRDGEVRIHAHRRTAQGGLSAHQPMTSTPEAITGTTPWTLLSGQFAMPGDTTQFELHLTMNTTGTVWHDGVTLAEVVPGRIASLQGRPVSPAELAVWPEPSVVKLFQDDPAPPAAAKEAELFMAGNEWETLQLAIRAGRRIDGVRVEADPPAGPGGRTLKDLEVNLVGFTPIDHPTSYYRSDGPAWTRMMPSQPGRCDGWPGMWPDPLLPADAVNLRPNRTQPIWITFKAPRTAAPGDYRGVVRLAAEGETLAQFPYRLHVWNFRLPDQSRMAAIYDVRLGRSAKLWGKSLDQIYPEIVDFMARRRLCPDRVRPEPSIRYEDGRVIADFRGFDNAAAWYFDQLKLPVAYAPSLFYLFGWGHPPKTFFGERPYEGEPPYADADRSRLRPEYKQAYQACLRTFWDHLKEKGWEKKVVLYISDEPYYRHEYIREQMKALCDMIHEVDSKIPIYSSTWKHVPDWDGYLNIWGIGHDGRTPVETMTRLRRSGARLWFTTDGQMCTDTPYCAVERLLPHYCFQYGVEAYEFWGVAWLTHNPFQFGWHSYIRQSGEPGEFHWVRYPNGDGYLLYPGRLIGRGGLVSSIRLEQAREGVEDYEYLRLLRERVERARRSGRSAALGEEALAAAAKLVPIPNPGGRYSSRILPAPEVLYQVRRRVAEAIEALAP